MASTTAQAYGAATSPIMSGTGQNQGSLPSATATAAYNLNGGRGAGSMDANGNFTPTPFGGPGIGNNNNDSPTGTPNSFTATNPGMGASPAVLAAARAPVTASTTTISNSNKQNQVAGIQNTTNGLSQTGITTDQGGNAVYANGTTVPAPAEPQTGTPQPNPSTTTTGGYVGDTYYAPGSQLPTDAQGNPQATTDSSPTDTQILNSLNTQKAQSDALTASAIDNIQAQYAQLIQQQNNVNQGQNALVNNALTMGGVTGQGSSAQFAPISSAAIMQSQVSYGISQIADLQTKENTAILAAQQAGQNQDFALQDKINSYISGIRDTKVAAANKLADTIATANATLATQKLAATQSTAVNNLYMSGVTDPSKILDTLNGQGMNMTADQVNKILESVDTDAVANLKTLQTAGITTPFANENGKIVNAQNGQAFDTPEEALKAMGVSSFEEAYAQGKISDIAPKLTFQTEKVNGQDVRFGFDAQGNVVSKTVLGSSGSGSGDGGSLSTAQAKDLNSQAEQAFSQVKGTDGYVSPDAWNKAADYYVSQGGLLKDFVSSHSAYINPKASGYQGNDSKTTATKTNSQFDSQLSEASGTDGYVSVSDWNSALQDFLDSNSGTTADFVKLFSDYVNPKSKDPYKGVPKS